MTDKTKTVLLIESQRLTIVRRRGRTVGAWYERSVTLLPVTPPAERPSAKGRARLCVWWRAVALKGVALFAPLTHRLKTGGSHRGGG